MKSADGTSDVPEVVVRAPLTVPSTYDLLHKPLLTLRSLCVKSQYDRDAADEAAIRALWGLLDADGSGAPPPPRPTPTLDPLLQQCNPLFTPVCAHTHTRVDPPASPGEIDADEWSLALCLLGFGRDKANAGPEVADTNYAPFRIVTGTAGAGAGAGAGSGGAGKIGFDAFLGAMKAAAKNWPRKDSNLEY